MPEFVYSALNAHGKEVWGSTAAPSEREAMSLIEARGLRRIRIRADKERGLSAMVERLAPVSARELAVTSRQLAVMLTAGIGIQQALAMLTQQPLGGRLREAWLGVQKEVHEGNYLSQGLQRYREVFGSLYVGLARAGEASGTLAANLQRMSDYLEADYMLRSRIKAALTYPVTVFVVCLGLAVVIVQHILPHFLNSIFKDMGQDLPWMTRVLIAVTNFFNDPRAIGTGLAITLVGGWMLAQHLRTSAGRRQLEKVLVEIPLFRDLMSKVLTCRVARTLATLLNSGMVALDGLAITADAVDHYGLSDDLKTAVQDLKDGHPLSRAMRAIPLFPPIFSAFVLLGEESGHIPELMDKVADIFEQDVETALLTFTQLIEPIMVAFMGGMVGFVLIAIFIPLYRVLGAF